MHFARWLLALLLLPLLAACAEPDKQWMKINQSYTAEEFRRDLEACTKGTRLDEECMRGRGWVSVNPGRTETPKPPEPQRPGYTPRR